MNVAVVAGVTYLGGVPGFNNLDILFMIIVRSPPGKEHGSPSIL